MYASQDEMLVYGWIRQETKDNIPTDLMNDCLECYKNDEWIKPKIHCTYGNENFTAAQSKVMNCVLLHSYEIKQSFLEFIVNTRDRLSEHGMSAMVFERVDVTWEFKGCIQSLRMSAWQINNREICIFSTKPPAIAEVPCCYQEPRNKG